jgi:hypothetical protein
MRAMPDVNAVMSEKKHAAASREARFTEAFGACYQPVLAYARRRVLDTAPALPRNSQFRELVAEWNRGCHQ